MGLSERHSAERNEETPDDVEGTIYVNGCALGGTFLQTEYWSSCAL